MVETETLSTSALIAATKAHLTAAGMQISTPTAASGFSRDRTVLAEDNFSVVVIVAYDTWNDLSDDWVNMQGELASLLTKRLAKSDARVWDGYLVLLTPSYAPDRASIGRIEADVTRVRKIVGTGEWLTTTADLFRLLDPFMPIVVPSGLAAYENVLELLPEITKKEVAPEAMRVAVQAYLDDAPIMDRLHKAFDDAPR